jgi:hypothetical protein
MATLAVLVALGAWWLLGRDRRTAPALPSPQAAAVAKNLLTRPYTEHGEGYDISAAYPTTTPMGEAAAEEMQGWVIGEIGHFKDTRASSTHSTLTITYEASSTALASSYLFTEEVNDRTLTKAFTFTASTTP